jgi:hypothetical protein
MPGSQRGKVVTSNSSVLGFGITFAGVLSTASLLTSALTYSPMLSETYYDGVRGSENAGWNKLTAHTVFTQFKSGSVIPAGMDSTGAELLARQSMCENNTMHRTPIATFVWGAIVLLTTGAIHLLEAFHGLGMRLCW